VPDFLVQRRRNITAAARLIRKLLKKTGITPSIMVTDKLGSYGAAKKMLGLGAVHEPGMGKKQPMCNLTSVCAWTRTEDATV